MLSRVADSLYWLSRYIERAENLARLVEENHNKTLDSRDSNGHDFIWNPVLYATCTEEFYHKVRAKDPAHLDVERFMTFSSANPDSIRNCIALARENARMVRDQISEEMWLELNSIHLFLRSSKAEAQFQDQPERFFRKVIQFSLLFQGLTEATILHDEGRHFTNLGKLIERADKTSRILDTLTLNPGEPDRHELVSTLRSCSAVSAFREEFLGEISLHSVASFLFFSSAFPRSVRFCLRRLDDTLHTISGVPAGTFSNEAERLTGSALARINFSNIEEILQTGLHESIDDLQKSLNDIGQRIFENYILLPFEIQNVNRNEGFLSQRQQQQQQQ